MCALPICGGTLRPIRELRIWNSGASTRADSYLQGVEFPGPRGISQTFRSRRFLVCGLAVCGRTVDRPTRDQLSKSGPSLRPGFRGLKIGHVYKLQRGVALGVGHERDGHPEVLALPAVADLQAVRRVEDLCFCFELFVVSCCFSYVYVLLLIVNSLCFCCYILDDGSKTWTLLGSAPGLQVRPPTRNQAPATPESTTDTLVADKWGPH